MNERESERGRERENMKRTLKETRRIIEHGKCIEYFYREKKNTKFIYFSNFNRCKLIAHLKINK